MANNEFKKLYEECVGDANEILSYTPETLSKMAPAYQEPEYSDFVLGVLKHADEQNYVLNPEEYEKFEIARAMHTICYEKSQMMFWRGRSVSYIWEYRVANGRTQLQNQQCMVQDALNVLLKHFESAV